jgi:alkylhydroperoxidase family enzyme
MARVDYSDPARHSERTRELLGKNRNANIFRMMAHSPSYLEQYCRLGGAIRHKGELDPIVRELAITRTGILCEAPYEIVAHKRIGKNVGVTDEQNEALENWETARRLPSPMRSSGATSRRMRPSTRLPRN